MALILKPRPGLATWLIVLIPGCLSVEQGSDYCGRQMELGSVFQSDAERLRSSAEFRGFGEYLVKVALK